jgi:hypothetical protein
MGRAVLAMIAVAAFAIALVVPDSASARASGVSRGSPATAVGRGVRSHSGGVFGGAHSGVSRGFAVRHGGVGWHGRAVGRRGLALGRRHRAVVFGAAGYDADPGFYRLWPREPGCQVQRVQIDDDNGWRVRDVVVCPGRGLSLP